GSAVGDVMLLGPGAGQMPTASAVVGDIINLAGALRLPDFAPYFQPPLSAQPLPLCPGPESGDVGGESAFYIRIETTDTPGVIGNLGTAFGNNHVSLYSLVQRGIRDDGTATIVLLTHKARESNVQSALNDITAQPTTHEIGIALPVMN